jgi:hypothetical protein
MHQREKRQTSILQFILVFGTVEHQRRAENGRLLNFICDVAGNDEKLSICAATRLNRQAGILIFKSFGNFPLSGRRNPRIERRGRQDSQADLSKPSNSSI